MFYSKIASSKITFEGIYDFGIDWQLLPNKNTLYTQE